MPQSRTAAHYFSSATGLRQRAALERLQRITPAAECGSTDPASQKPLGPGSKAFLQVVA
jgi:hypothetical protein